MLVKMDTQESVSKVRLHVLIEKKKKKTLGTEHVPDPKRIYEQPATDLSVPEASY